MNIKQKETGLLLGWHGSGGHALGFARASAPSFDGEEPVWYNGDGHLITLAPTRSGKGRGVLAPTLLHYPGPIVVFDPKAELYHITARRRRELGQRVVCLDPCRITGAKPDTLNPLDIFLLDNADLETDAQMLGSCLSDGNRFSKEPFWDQQASSLHSALIAHVASACPTEERNLETVRRLLISDDTVYGLATLLDTHGKKMNRMAHDEIASFLQTTDVTRSGILSTACSYIKPFLSPRMATALCNSTFSLRDMVDGAPLTIYMVLPPDKLRSHKALLKLWVATFLKAITSRRQLPAKRTLLLLDECAQLENFPYLESVITLCAGYGATCWSIWQDLAQLKSFYPTSWETIINNCAVLQTFGFNNRHIASQWGNFVDFGPDTLLSLSPEHEVLQIHGRKGITCRRPDYLTDRIFAGHFDENPLYGSPSPPKQGAAAL